MTFKFLFTINAQTQQKENQLLGTWNSFNHSPFVHDQKNR